MSAQIAYVGVTFLTIALIGIGLRYDQSKPAFALVAAVSWAIALVSYVTLAKDWSLHDFLLLKVAHRSTAYLMVLYAVGSASFVLLLIKSGRSGSKSGSSEKQ